MEHLSSVMLAFHDILRHDLVAPSEQRRERAVEAALRLNRGGDGLQAYTQSLDVRALRCQEPH